MCVVSMVTDHYRDRWDKWPESYPINPGSTTYFFGNDLEELSFIDGDEGV